MKLPKLSNSVGPIMRRGKLWTFEVYSPFGAEESPSCDFTSREAARKARKEAVARCAGSSVINEHRLRMAEFR